MEETPEKMANKTFTEQESIKLFGKDPHGHIIIPDGYTSIGEEAFYGCTRLTNITIPNSVTSIGDYAFYDCASLINVTIPNSVTSIGDSAFCDCTNLTSITIPDSVSRIGDCAFLGCKSLTSKKGNYKVFDIVNDELLCMGYEYFPKKWSDKIDNIKLCEMGYHYCTNLFEIFNYYYGELDKEIAIYECEIGDKVLQEADSSKCVTNRIKPVKRLYKEDVRKILNGGRSYKNG